MEAVGFGEALVEGVGLAAVLFADPEGEVLFVALDDVDGAVGAATVDDDVLEFWVVLGEDGVDGLLQEGGLVVAGGDDREMGRDHGRGSRATR